MPSSVSRLSIKTQIHQICLFTQMFDRRSNGCRNKLRRVINIKSNLSGPSKHMAVTYAFFNFSNLADLDDLVC